MKKKLLQFFLLIVAPLLLINATTAQYKKLSASVIENSVVNISPHLYACKYETSNWLYLQFLADLKKNERTEDLKAATVDSLAWNSLPWHSGIQTNDPYVTYYLRHPAYADYPVVNISYEAANLFCKWLTDKYNAMPNRKYKNVLFRLPTEQEWCLAARGGLPNPIYSCGDTLRDKKGEFMCVFHYPLPPNFQGPNGIEDVTAPVESYWKNGFGISNMSGNAAEMVSEKGITKGGSWHTSKEQLRIDAKGVYEKPACDIGFRYFMEVKSN